MTELLLKIQKHRKSLPIRLSVFTNNLSAKNIFKIIFDFSVSIISITILIPVFLCIGIIIKLTSTGSIIYQQERIGKNGQLFNIYKFRSMYIDAEKNGPQLSAKNDKRITGIGKILRKTRLDEIPQFFNVLKGEMSIIGPRPERQFYIDQIVRQIPEFIELLKVKPGITSLGQVKFGYAENVDQMLQRLKYDLYYINNKSLMLELEILYKTLVVILKADGT